MKIALKCARVLLFPFDWWHQQLQGFLLKLLKYGGAFSVCPSELHKILPYIAVQ